jgi:pyruvate dehydrogenase E2 component (dihydrolipoamide acetyltransferase)
MPDQRIQRVLMPKWGLSMKHGKIVEWLVAEGDPVSKGDDLADIETDKIAGTLESSEVGVLRRIVAPAGSDVPVSRVIAVVAPAEVADDEVEAVVAEARAALESGEIEEVGGPDIGTVEVAGRTLNRATLGAGEDVVVLVHGYGGDANSWLFVQEPLADGRVVHALDLPGHGSSSKDVGDGTLDTLAGAVLGFLDALGVEHAHLVGHSLGGAVVVAAAAAAPQRVRSLTLVAPAGFGTPVDAGYLRGFAAASARRELKPLLGRLFADEGLVTRQLIDDVLRYKRLDGVDAALTTLLDTLLAGDEQAIDARALLAGTRMPAVVVWGREDRVVRPLDPGGLGDRAEIRLVDGAGHMVHMERPHEVRAAVQDVMRRA